jgi:hypothetical protein
MSLGLWIRLLLGLALSSAVGFGGYKIGEWKEGAGEAADASKAAANLAQCKADLAAQREADAIGANHALSDQLRDATDLAHKDAAALGDLAAQLQNHTLEFAANTRALYEIAVGTCSFTPEFVGLLNRAADQANAPARNFVEAAASGKTDSGNAASAEVSKPSH